MRMSEREMRELIGEDAREHVPPPPPDEFDGGIPADAAFGRDPRFQRAEAEAEANEKTPF